MNRFKPSLGLSFGYHDSAVCLIISDSEIYAEQEERFTRVKFDANFPSNGIKWLSESGKLSNVENCIYYEDPKLKYSRLLKQILLYGYQDIRLVPEFISSLIVQKRKYYSAYIKTQIKNCSNMNMEISFSNHHASHAASTFYTSKFNDAAILVVDGVGEKYSTTIWVGNGNSLEFVQGIKFPNSIGFFYSIFSFYCGFKVNSGEYKFMGLAPYGEPLYKEIIRENFLALSKSGEYKIQAKKLKLGSIGPFNVRALEKLFNKPRRVDAEPILQFHADVAASVQFILNEIMLNQAKLAMKVTRMDKLCLAGGVALNCVSNKKIVEEIGEDSVHFFSASGDAGGALGAAAIQFLEINKEMFYNVNFRIKLNTSKLGKYYTKEYCRKFLKELQIIYTELHSKEIATRMAQEINRGKVVAVFSGASEFGPRALGNRSILADARINKGQIMINKQIKFRESFRPFAPIVLDEFKSLYFEMSHPSPYMLRTVQVKGFHKLSELRKEDNEIISIDQRLNEIHSPLPGITHLDGSARVQTISRFDDSMSTQILSAFYTLTQCPVLINTSFNVKGEPIVGSPQDAFNCFMTTGIDFLVLENFLIDKEDVIHLKNNYRSKVAED